MGAYEVVVKNYAEESENKIHSDQIAKRYGFEGALVPGAAVFGHLTRPLVERFGERWLTHSLSNVRFIKPAYDGDTLSVTLDGDEGGYHVKGINAAGTLLAEMHGSIPDELPAAEDQAVFEAPAKSPARPTMTWDTVVEGQPFAIWHFQVTDSRNRIYAEQVADDFDLYRFVAHPHWLLSTANRALTRDYVMPAWIHVGSEIRFRALVRVGDTLAVRAVPLEKWERKGHQFVRLYLTYYRDDLLTTEIFHTAIFRVAE